MTSLAIVELAARFGDPAHQVREVERLLGNQRGALVLLSECALSGYVDVSGACDLRAFAEPAVTVGEDLKSRSETSSLSLMAHLASRTQNTIVAPCIERAGDVFFNSSVVIDPSGRALVRYRKRHPWYPETWATPGAEQIPTFQHRRLHVAIAICFDVHFVAEESAEELRAADVLLFPSAWVDDTPADAREAILGELARTFEVVIVNANWGHGEPRVRGQGSSRVVRPDGTQQLLRAPGILSVVL